MTVMHPIPQTDTPGHRTLRPLMLTSQFLPEVFGGAEQQCLRLSQALVQLGHKPHILTSRSSPETPAESTSEGVRITRLLSPRPPQIGGRHIGSTVQWMAQVNRWCAANRARFDLIHCHQAKLNAWIGVRIARQLGIPSIVKPGSAGRNFDLLGLSGKRFLYGRLAAQEIAQKADRFVAISNEMVTDLLNYGVDHKRIIQIPNGIPPAQAISAPAITKSQLGISTKTPVLLFVGRLEAQKNAHTLLKAFAAQTEPCHLVLVGDGTERESLTELSQSLGINNRCHFVGQVNDATPWYQLADIFVLPAIAEGMSNALLEAMREGLLPIASQVSGNTDLITHLQNGLLYSPPQCPSALTQVLHEALSMQDAVGQEIRFVAKGTVRRNHLIQKIATHHASLYRTLQNDEIPKCPKVQTS